MGGAQRKGMGAQIDERVRAAHLSHFCPGGLGFPVKSATATTLHLEDADFVRALWVTAEDHEARAAGSICRRCHVPIAVHHEVRRHACGEWVHANCPPGRR